MADDAESWRDIDPQPLFTAAVLRAGRRAKRIKVEPGIKTEPAVKVEPGIKVQDVKSERTLEPSSPPSSEASYPTSPDASCPPSPADSCSSPPPEASCPSPEAEEFEEAEAEAEEEEEEEEGEEQEEEDEEEEEEEHPYPYPPSCGSPSPEPPEITTLVTRKEKCRTCQEPAVLRYVEPQNERNAGRPYFVCPDCPWGVQWVCWADERGMSAVNPECYCKGRVPSRLEVICKTDTGKCGRGFWTCARKKCDYYSENLDGEPGVSFEGGFYPLSSGGKKRKYCD